MSRPEERSEPTEETQEEPEHGSSLHDSVVMTRQEVGVVNNSLILGQILATVLLPSDSGIVQDHEDRH
jgi:hypothetical protein